MQVEGLQMINWSAAKYNINDLKDYEHNPRILKKNELDKLVKSIKQDGYHQRVIIDIDGTIIGGHQRKKALLKAGLKEIEVLVPDRKLTEEEFDRINIRDNLQVGEFDFDILSNRFEPETLIDWGMPEEWLKVDIEEIPIEEGDNNVPEIPVDPTTKLGDVWLLGEHRLMCGSATSVDDIDKLLDSSPIDMVYTDPPYGINEETDRDFASRTRKCKGNKFDKIIGDDSVQTAIDAYNVCAAMNIDIMVFFGGNYYAHALPQSGNWLVWDKRVEEKQRDMNSDCELAWVKSKNNSVRIFRHLWKGMIKGSENGQARVHPTQKPIELALWCFKEYGADAKIILDLFGGSGSTLIACEKAKKKCFMMELSPKYCDVIVARWEKLSEQKAVLENAEREWKTYAGDDT